ncbi:MAG: Cof-type HAD-IIB family hydrolase [Mycoplasmatales bacterium]
MKRIVFFDIDGTLLPEGQEEISSDVIKEVNSIRNDDTEIFVCTGRCYHQAKKYIDMLGSASYICSNGQEVCYKGEIVYNKVFSEKEVLKIKNIIEEENCGWGYETRKNIYLPENSFSINLMDVLEGYGFQDILISDKNISDGAFQIWTFGEESSVDKIINNLGSKYKAYKWNEQSAEILPFEESKAKGIKIVNDILTNQGHEVKSYAFGDGVNDVDMFQYVDVAVVMGNATGEIKKYGTFISTDCREGGIKNGLVLAGLK